MIDIEGFLMELDALSRKYEVEIGGCGCCGSPWVIALEKNGPEYGYVVRTDGTDYDSLDCEISRKKTRSGR